MSTLNIISRIRYPSLRMCDEVIFCINNGIIIVALDLGTKKIFCPDANILNIMVIDQILYPYLPVFLRVQFWEHYCLLYTSLTYQ